MTELGLCSYPDCTEEAKVEMSFCNFQKKGKPMPVCAGHFFLVWRVWDLHGRGHSLDDILSGKVEIV